MVIKMNLTKLNKTELIQGMYDLSLKTNEVYALDTIIEPFCIRQGLNSEPVDIHVSAGRLTLPVSYAYVDLNSQNPEVEVWSIFLNKYSKGKKVPDSWRKGTLSGYFSDWEDYIRDHIGINESGLTRCYAAFDVSDGVSLEKITSVVDRITSQYFIIRDKFEKNEVSRNFQDFKADPPHLEMERYRLDKLKRFHDEIKKNVMQYFKPQ
jgi:hypothetical protein